jgi:hypothetical protein
MKPVGKTYFINTHSHTPIDEMSSRKVVNTLAAIAQCLWVIYRCRANARKAKSGESFAI